MPLQCRYVKRCNNCEDLVAVCLCDQCDDYYCEPCWASLHKRGQQAKHKRMMLDVCCDCEYQVASRKCRACVDVFCDTCFKFTHARGAMLEHDCDYLLDMCEHCHDYAARCVLPLPRTPGGGSGCLLY